MIIFMRICAFSGHENIKNVTYDKLDMGDETAELLSKTVVIGDEVALGSLTIKKLREIQNSNKELNEKLIAVWHHALLINHIMTHLAFSELMYGCKDSSLLTTRE